MGLALDDGTAQARPELVPAVVTLGIAVSFSVVVWAIQALVPEQLERGALQLVGAALVTT